jgi:cytochrome P450
MLHDPAHFPSPHTFNPTRFLTPTPNPDPRKYIFGFGRRVCSGLHIANNNAWMMCAGVLAAFDVRAGEELVERVGKLGGRESERLCELFLPFGVA